ncbi:hypothetical protein FRC11_009497 [Ceratobasidium sp. 423]|nr:hypothetical protein FRC11_009497 [Ceratobasidium sp. 423]
MAADLPPAKAAQIKRLREQQANINKMISSIAGKEAAESLSDPLANTIPILGFQSFTKPSTSRGFNLQELCGLTDRMWSIYKDELRGVAIRQGVDIRFSITKQPIQLCITDTVNEMIKLRPEIKTKISDPDWFIRQTLKAMLKSSGEIHRNRMNDKPKRNQKAKKTSKVDADGDKDKVEDEDEDENEDENKDEDEGKEDKKRGKGKEKDEQEDMEMTDVDEVADLSAPQASTSGNRNMDTGTNQGESVPPLSNSTTFDSTPAPPVRRRPPMKTRLLAEEFHIARDWSSPVQTPFSLGRYDPENNISNGEEPTPMPTKIQQIVKPKPSIRKTLVSYSDSDSDEAEDHERTPKPPTFTVQAKNAQVFTKVSNDHNQTLEREVPGAKAPIKQLAHAALSQRTTKPNSTPEVESHCRHENTAKIITTPAMDTNLAGSKKRKASEDDAIPEASAPKKGRAMATPARVLLVKNLEMPLPASPVPNASRVTRSQAPRPPATSSSVLPRLPAAPKSKAEIRKAAAQKAATTRATNKKAREAAAQSKAENESKELAKRKK